jgi:hypothetical protein
MGASSNAKDAKTTLDALRKTCMETPQDSSTHWMHRLPEHMLEVTGKARAKK